MWVGSANTKSYTFDARLNTERAEQVTWQNHSLAALQNLRQLLNLPATEDIAISFIDTAMLSTILNTHVAYNGLSDAIILNNPIIKQAEMAEQAAHFNEKIARSNMLPRLSVGGNLVSNYNVDQTNADNRKIPLSQQLNDNLGQNINISLRIPIFSQLENSNRVKKEKLNVANARLAIEEARNTVISNTLQLVNDFNAAKQRYIASQSAHEQNALSYALYAEKYRLGQISSVELITAKDILTTAASKFLQAKLQVYFQYKLLELLK